MKYSTSEWVCKIEEELYKNRFSYKSVSCTILKKTVTATLHDIEIFDSNITQLPTLSKLIQITRRHNWDMYASGLNTNKSFQFSKISNIDFYALTW